MIVVLALLGCAPALTRMPGPLDRLGRGAPESLADYLARRHGSGGDDEVVAVGSAPPNATARGIAEAARGFVGDGKLVVEGETYRYDCSGFVEATLAKAGVTASGSSLMLYEAARESGVLHHRRLPHPGDVAFWDNTYDRDHNGVLDDDVTHSGIVAAVSADGTIDIVHLGNRGVTHLRMNLKHPHDQRSADGETINDYLRARSKSDPFGTEYLAGELWTGFASFWVKAEVVAEAR